MPYVFLRNGCYTENWTGGAWQAAEHGAIRGSAGDGRIASVARADLAAAAAVVLTGGADKNAVYELSGDVGWTMDELAGEITALSGRHVRYQDLPADEYARVLAGHGIPEQVATVIADFDARAAEGWLADATGDLAKLIGRPATPLRDAVRAAL